MVELSIYVPIFPGDLDVQTNLSTSGLDYLASPILGGPSGKCGKVRGKDQWREPGLLLI